VGSCNVAKDGRKRVWLTKANRTRDERGKFQMANENDDLKKKNPQEQNPPADDGKGQKDPDVKPKTYTQAEVDALISKAAESYEDKIKTRLESELQPKIDEAIKEAQRLAKLSEEERLGEELKAAQKKLAEDRAALERDKLKIKIDAELLKRELPSSLSDMLLESGGWDKAYDQIEKIDKDMKAAVQKAVEAKYKKDPPSVSSGKKTGEEVNEFAKKANERAKVSEKAIDPWKRN